MEQKSSNTSGIHDLPKVNDNEEKELREPQDTKNNHRSGTGNDKHTGTQKITQPTQSMF